MKVITLILHTVNGEMKVLLFRGLVPINPRVPSLDSITQMGKMLPGFVFPM